LLNGVENARKAPELLFDPETIEDMSEEERWKEEEIWETLSVAENREELQKEIVTLDGLIQRARSIIRREDELKLKELRKSLAELTQADAREDSKKILVFTESRDTLEYLSRKTTEWGYKTNIIHGGMKLEDRVKAEGVFKTETELLVATEAAGEGINLQFCNLMINYDIPWNPNRLEQRMGRIHRYGQQKEVYVFNLVAEDTREGKVLYRLFEKLDEIRIALGSDKVFDVLSEVLYDKSVSQLLMDAAANARSIDDILREIDITVDEDYIANVKENLGESLATHYIDYTRIREMAQQAREYRLIPEYTEAFFRKGFVKAGGKLREREDGFLGVDSVPFDLRKIAQQDPFKKRYGELLRRYPKVTFDKEVAFRNPDAAFLSFGHPLFEATMSWIEKSFSDALQRGATFVDPDGRLEGFVLFYEGEVKDGTGKVAGRRLFGFYVAGDEVKPINPALIWDLAEAENAEAERVDIDKTKGMASDTVIARLQDYKNEIAKERHRQAEIKEKYGVRSLGYLIVKLDGELITLYDRKSRGENVDLTIRNKEERKSEYERALAELKKEIDKEKSLTMSMPRFDGIIRVTRPAQIHGSMISDEEIEKVGMQVVMEYERQNGREPYDVSAENLGFDIRATDREKNTRYIEVKARRETGAIALTQNEWFKAKRFKEDYYLCAVMNAAATPQLYIIQNPAENLEPSEKVEAVRYIVPFTDIVQKGDEASE